VGAAVVGAAVLLASVAAAHAQALRGHGGPVRAVVVSTDGAEALTGSFDTSIIRWDLRRGTAAAVLRGHAGAVTALAVLGPGRYASAGEDGRILLWSGGSAAPERVLATQPAAITGLALSPDGSTLAASDWDGTAWLLPLREPAPAPRALTGHVGHVAGIGFLPDGGVVTGGYDGTLRFRTADGAVLRTLNLGAAVNAMAVSASGTVAVAGADGALSLLAPGAAEPRRIPLGERPLIALAVSADGTRVAAGGLSGGVSIVEVASGRVLAQLIGPGLPVWSLAFVREGRELLSGGADRLVRRWDALTGEHLGEVVPVRGPDVLAGLSGHRGAEVFRACAACHTLTPDDGNRAGPTLHGLFGRRIGSVPGYAYSAALPAMDIVWTRETVMRLFELGPNTYTPGTRMPEQTITSAADREALVDWLAEVTRPR
jgi:cytochrome c